jgi:CHASE2 domain-containing sensor protein
VHDDDGPYVGLDFFREKDAGLFFGRDAERTRIISNLRASRLTLLYATSGVGKSSLLRAGVAARLRPTPGRAGAGREFLPVLLSSWRADPRADLLGALAETLQPYGLDGDHLAAPEDGLEPALRDAIALTGATPLVILDQFEDRLLAPNGDDESFEDELAACINQPDLRANFLISIRDDAYSAIGERFKARIPNVYRNFLHLDFLDREAGRQAILRPVEAYNAAGEDRAFEVEPELCDAVLEEVGRGRVALGDDGPAGAPGRAAAARVETAYLQLVMKRVWSREVASGSSRLRLETLRDLGGAATIVRSHVDEVMAALDDRGQDAAAAALRYLVTSTGRTMALSTGELAEFSDVPPSRLDPALHHLEDERVLRSVPAADPGGVPRHELFHDALAPAVVDWRRRHLQKRERAAAELALERERRRARRLEVRNRRLAAAVIGLIAVTAALVVYAWNPDAVRRLELGTIDERFELRPDRTPAGVTLVGVDPPNGAGFTRRDYGRLIRAIDSAGPRAIAVDVAFDSPTATNTNALLGAIRVTRAPLAFAYSTFDIQPNDEGPPELVPTVAPFASHRRSCRAGAAHRVCFGYAGMPTDPDGAIRRLEASTPTTSATAAAGGKGPELVPFPVAVAGLVGKGSVPPRVARGASRRAWQGQTQQTMWIDYPGPPARIRTVAAADVTAGRAPAGALRDRLVLVGVTSGVDVRETPFGRATPGPAIQAAAIDTLLRGAPLRDAPFAVDVALILILGLLAPAVLALTGSVPRAALAAVAGGVVFVLAAYLAFRGGRVISVIVPLGALAGATAGVLAKGPATSLWRASLRRARGPSAESREPA